MKKIIKWWNDCFKLNKEEAAKNLKSGFRVTEKNGFLYLTHHGYAFCELPSYASASEILAKLDEARKASLRYEGLCE